MNSDKEKVRLLHTENSIAFTGAFKSLLNFCIYSQQNIYSVVLIRKGSSCKQILESHGIKVYELPFIEISRKPFHLLLYFPFLIYNGWKIRKIALAERIDILHSNDFYNLSLLTAKYVFGLKKSIIVHVRMLPASFPSLLYKIWRYINISLANKLVGVSFAVNRAYGDPEKMSVIYDVERKPEKYPSFECKTNDDKPFRFLYLANYIYGKGQDCAINAFEILVKKNPEVTLTFAGGNMGLLKNSKYRSSLIEQSKRKGLETKVFFENFAEDTELKLKQYDASLNFSYSESFSQVSYESLRYGVPLISSDCGGPAELFINGESGLLVKNKCVSQMAEAMYKISTDFNLRKKFSQNSKKHVQDKMSRISHYHNLEELIIEMNRELK